MTRGALRIAAAAAVFLFPGVAHPSGPPDGPREPAALRDLIRPGEKAPPFALEDLDGRVVAVKPGNRQATLLVFFSSFCPMCRELAPSIGEIASRRAGTIRVVGVNLDGKRFSNAVRSFVKEYRLVFPVLLDEIRDDLFLASDPYGVSKTPTAVLIDGRGIVRASFAADAMREFLAGFDRIAADLEKGNGPAK